MWMTITRADAWEREPRQEDFLLRYPNLDISGLYTSVQVLCLFSSFIFLYLLWSDCFHNKNQPAKKMNRLQTDLALQTLIPASCALWVGFGFLSIYPCCALEDAPGQLTWAYICPERHEVLAHLSASRRQGSMAPGQLKCHCTAQVTLTCSEPLHSVQRLRESFLMRFVFGQKIEFLFILLCDNVPLLQAEFPI